MLDKDQAFFVAEELLSQERQRSIDARNASARQVPWYYTVEELKDIQPFERAEVILFAQRQAASLYIVLALALIIALAAIWHLFSGANRFGQFLPSIVIASVFAGALRPMLVRIKLRRILQSRKQSAGSVQRGEA